MMCNYLNNYDNLNGWSLHSVYIFMKNVHKKCIPYLTGKFSKLCSNKKSHYGFKTYPYPNILIHLANWTIYVKFELQTHLEHPSSLQSGVLVVFVLLNL